MAAIAAIAFVIFSEAKAGNDIELTPDQELIVRAALGEEVEVRIKVAENIPLPQAQTYAPPAMAKPAAPVKQEMQAKAKPSNPDKEVRKIFAMKLPVENRLINGKFYKEVWIAVDEVNGKVDDESKKILGAPPEGAEIVPYEG